MFECVSQFGPESLESVYIGRFCIEKTCYRLTTNYKPVGDHFQALSTWWRRYTNVPQFVLDHFIASGTRISYTTVRRYLQNSYLYARRLVVCVSGNRISRNTHLRWAREHLSWIRQQWASILFTDESMFILDSDSGRRLQKTYEIRLIQHFIKT